MRIYRKFDGSGKKFYSKKDVEETKMIQVDEKVVLKTRNQSIKYEKIINSMKRVLKPKRREIEEEQYTSESTVEIDNDIVSTNNLQNNLENIFSQDILSVPEEQSSDMVEDNNNIFSEDILSRNEELPIDEHISRDLIEEEDNDLSDSF